MVTTNKYRKPHPDFPLFPHPNGYWAKKVRGKTEYFGRIDDDPKGELALKEWVENKDLLLIGRRRRVSVTDALTVADLANRFLTWKRTQYNAGDIHLLTLRNWYKICAQVVEQFGAKTAVEDLGPDDFGSLIDSRTGNAPRTRRAFIGSVRGLFSYAYNADQRLISTPVLFGAAFRKPKLPRRQNGQEGKGRVLTSDQIRKIIWISKPPLRAMVLLGINCGFGNTDCATLTFGNLDLESGWHTHPRPKTDVYRRCPLWGETVAAIQDWLKMRPKPADRSYADLVFLTRNGLPYIRASARALASLAAGNLDHLLTQDSIRTQIHAMLCGLGIKRNGLSFYSLRHTFETIGGAAKDQIAVDAIMGHITPGMGTNYRDSVDDDRLRAVSDHVHAWLFPSELPTPLVTSGAAIACIADDSAQKGS